MNEAQERKQLRKAVDSTLSGLQSNPYLFQRVMARHEEGEQTMKKYPKLSLALVLTLVCVMSLFTVAAASGLLERIVDWDGQVINTIETPDAPQVLPTATPPGTNMSRVEREEAFRESIECNPGDIVAIREGDDKNGGASWIPVIYPAADMADLAARLPETMPLPVNIPEGYEFHSANIYYKAKSGSEYQFVARKDSGEDFYAEIWHLNREDAIPTQYEALFRNPETGAWTTVFISLHESMENYEFGVPEGTTVRAVEVPGMEKALLFVSEDEVGLNMYTSLAEPVAYHRLDLWGVAVDSVCHYLVIDINCDAGEEAALALMGN